MSVMPDLYAPTLIGPYKQIPGGMMPMPGHPAPPSPADLARQRKNQAIDQKRRAGTQALQTMQAMPAQAPAVAAPPIVGSPGAPNQPLPKQAASPYVDQPPQMQNVPFTPATFTPAQYKQPPKGLEYLAAGIALLFPGAPISHAAEGLLQGMQQGAESGYQRREQQAEQQYNVQETNTRDLYSAAQANAQTAFQNAQLLWQNRKDLRAQGINPITQKPFTYPALQQVMKRGDTSIAGTMEGYNRLIQLAQRNGDSGAVAQYQRAAQDYQAQALEQMRSLTDMQKLFYTQSQENARTAYTQGQENVRSSNTQQSDWQRQYQRENFDLTQRQTVTPQQKLQLQADAGRSLSSFQTEYRALTVPQLGSKNATVSGDAKTVLDQNLRLLQHSSDPAGLADFFAAQASDAATGGLFQEYGQALSLSRQARGIPIRPVGVVAPKLQPFVFQLQEKLDAGATPQSVTTALHKMVQQHAITEQENRAIRGALGWGGRQSNAPFQAPAQAPAYPGP